MLKYIKSENMVYAFEPFPGNHRFFRSEESQIKLIPCALAATEGTMPFHVSSTVDENSAWGKKGMVGYSSVGFLVTGEQSENDIAVKCVRADDVIPQTANIGFIKLDLQGGELDALKGMERLLQDVAFMWVEFSGQSGLLDFLITKNMVVFDTEYFFKGSPDKNALIQFDVTKRNITLSTGQTAWFGFRKRSWKNFELDFRKAKTELQMVQTDLVCVPRSKIGKFVKAISFL